MRPWVNIYGGNQEPRRRLLDDMEEFRAVEEVALGKFRQFLTSRKNFHGQHIGAGGLWLFVLQKYEKFSKNVEISV